MALLTRLNETWQSLGGLAESLERPPAEVAAWAHRLKEEGYPLELGPEGYRLAPGTPTPRALKPLLRGTFGQLYRYEGALGSTQDAMRTWAEEGAGEGALLLAERQEAGRGRQGRVWTSRAGAGLTFSLLLRPRLPLAQLSLLPLAAGVALVEACGVGGLKWPNDLLAPDGRKLAGVLLEAKLGAEGVRYAVLGVGLNVYPPVPEGAAAVAEYASRSRVELLADLLDRLEARYHQLYHEPEGVLEAYRAHSLTLGREVKVTTQQGGLQGQAVGLGPDGALLLKVGGQIRAIGAGDVQLVGQL
ncbi:MAG: biotin--[acetyl-CoA-carboxylase] ligase [Thermaceae bacterium]|nr:biotin--[acetyl-CoA-carboxylase] ligase [Thermaceae bacterium]